MAAAGGGCVQAQLHQGTGFRSERFGQVKGQLKGVTSDIAGMEARRTALLAELEQVSSGQLLAELEFVGSGQLKGGSASIKLARPGGVHSGMVTPSIGCGQFHKNHHQRPVPAPSLT